MERSPTKIISGTTRVTANTTGYISFTTGGTTTGYMDTSGNFVMPGVSLTTSGISSTNGYFSAPTTIASNLTIAGNTGSYINFQNNGTYVQWGGGAARMTGDVTNKYLAFSTSGTEAMRIVSSGYVGIGTTAPAGPLDVSGTNGRMYLDTAGSSLVFTRSGDNSIRAAATGGKIGLYTNNNTRLLVDSTGNVSIGTGTLNASATLHVSGTARITSYTYIGDNVTPTAPLEVSGTVSATRFVGDGSGLTGIVGASSGDNIASGTTRVTANTTGYISFTTGGTTTGYMDTAGKFILPGISLTTAGVSSTNGYFSGNASTDGNFVLSASGGRLTWGAVTNDSIHGDASANNHYIRFTTSGTEAMRIVSTGYVGIGVTSPSGKTAR
ncbi:hypothetical protein [Bradyrhizobium sp. CCGE-LA001]|uniref:hypothetical protein n=1 Tax=Bradyrhizobium sp. CCGE-LA001 TaxID=1223566 RepID=UPI000745C5EC|nr:hypothetical protein [Bradyrhizobium sp. CCGE-LA001]AMA60138.1 hypothetical protein BCCGELA001_30505 [Bradyrhizobium sp. CCGE-LA001]